MSLNLFQILAVIVLGCLCVLTIVAAVCQWATRREAGVWVLIWLLAGVAVVWPGLTGRLARSLGIGRGADLVLYCTVVVMMIGFMMVYVRLRRVRRDLTLLVRQLAIENAHVNASPEGSKPRPQPRNQSAGPSEACPSPS